MRMTWAPASARPMATDWPMPLVQPVIMAVWPSSENMLAAILNKSEVKGSEIGRDSESELSLDVTVWRGALGFGGGVSIADAELPSWAGVGGELPL